MGKIRFNLEPCQSFDEIFSKKQLLNQILEAVFIHSFGREGLEYFMGGIKGLLYQQPIGIELRNYISKIIFSEEFGKTLEKYIANIDFDSQDIDKKENFYKLFKNKDGEIDLNNLYNYFKSLLENNVVYEIIKENVSQKLLTTIDTEIKIGTIIELTEDIKYEFLSKKLGILYFNGDIYLVNNILQEFIKLDERKQARIETVKRGIILKGILADFDDRELKIEKPKVYKIGLTTTDVPRNEQVISTQDKITLNDFDPFTDFDQIFFNKTFWNKLNEFFNKKGFKKGSIFIETISILVENPENFSLENLKTLNNLFDSDQLQILFKEFILSLEFRSDHGLEIFKSLFKATRYKEYPYEEQDIDYNGQIVMVKKTYRIPYEAFDINGIKNHIIHKITPLLLTKTFKENILPAIESIKDKLEGNEGVVGNLNINGIFVVKSDKNKTTLIYMEKIYIILNENGKILYTMNAIDSLLQVLRDWLYNEFSLKDWDIINGLQQVNEVKEKKKKCKKNKDKKKKKDKEKSKGNEVKKKDKKLPTTTNFESIDFRNGDEIVFNSRNGIIESISHNGNEISLEGEDNFNYVNFTKDGLGVIILGDKAIIAYITSKGFTEFNENYVNVLTSCNIDEIFQSLKINTEDFDEYINQRLIKLGNMLKFQNKFEITSVLDEIFEIMKNYKGFSCKNKVSQEKLKDSKPSIYANIKLPEIYEFEGKDENILDIVGNLDRDNEENKEFMKSVINYLIKLFSLLKELLNYLNQIKDLLNNEILNLIVGDNLEINIFNKALDYNLIINIIGYAYKEQ